jgi:DNA-directed RNA polymerase subunit RPC12/RpoP
MTEVYCHKCGRKLDEPSDLPFEQRTPCPDCGERARLFQVGVQLSGDSALETQGEVVTDERGVTVYAPGAVASAVARPPADITTGSFKRSVTWSKTPGGLWFGEVHDSAGKVIGVAVQSQAEDVLLVLAEDLLPPE